MITELTQDRENRLLEGTYKTLCTPGPGERNSDPTRDRPRLACECPGVSSRGMGWPAAESGALCAAVHAQDRLKEVGSHCLHYLHHNLLSDQTIGQEHSPTHQQKIRLKVY